jgi:hypothetical protein
MRSKTVHQPLSCNSCGSFRFSIVGWCHERAGLMNIIRSHVVIHADPDFDAACQNCGRRDTSAWRKLSINGVDYKVCNGMFIWFSKFRMRSCSPRHSLRIALSEERRTPGTGIAPTTILTSCIKVRIGMRSKTVHQPLSCNSMFIWFSKFRMRSCSPRHSLRIALSEERRDATEVIMGRC